MNNHKGFTLIELLVVVAIIGILAAVAIPQFASYRNQSFCARVMSDAKNAFTSMEAYFAEHLVYGSLADTPFASSPGVSIRVDNTDPLVVSAIDDTAQCPQGTTYTLSESSGRGSWS